MEITVLEEDRNCNYCKLLFSKGTSYLVVFHHIRYCAQNPRCKVLWCFACKARLKGLDKIHEHFKSQQHKIQVGAEDPSGKLERPSEAKLIDMFVKPLKEHKKESNEEKMETNRVKFIASLALDKNAKAKENWKLSATPWETSGATPASRDFFNMKGKKFQVIVIDPPWGFDRRWTKSSALHHYPTMKDEAIYSIPLQQLAADDCMLLVWGVDTKIPEAMEAIKRWGFTFKKKFITWVKIFKNKKTLVCGMGNYTRGCTEDCYLASRGRITQYRDARDVSQLLIAERMGHSEKPEKFWATLERYFGENYVHLNKIEIFSRKKREGWFCWGNEVH